MLLNWVWSDTNDSTKLTATASNITWATTSPVWYQKWFASFNWTTSKITYWNAWNVKSVSLWVYLDTTTEQIFEWAANDNELTVSTWTLSYPDWDNVFVDWVDTDTITWTAWHHIVLTSTTDVACWALTLWLFNTDFGSLDIAMFRTYSVEIDTTRIQSLYQEWLRQLWTWSYFWPNGLLKDCTNYWWFHWDALNQIWTLNWTVTEASLSTDIFWIANESYLFDWTNDKIALWNVWNIKSVWMWINLVSTTEQIFEGAANNNELTVSTWTLSYPDWDNVYVDWVDTDTITTGWHHILLTSTTDVNCSAMTLWLFNTDYGNLYISEVYTYTSDVSTNAIWLYQVSKNKYLI